MEIEFDIRKKQKKILPTGQFWSKIWKEKEHRNTEWIYKKMISKTRRPRSEYTPGLSETNNQDSNGFCFEKFTSVHDRLSQRLSKCLQEEKHTRIDDEEENNPDPKISPQKNHH